MIVCELSEQLLPGPTNKIVTNNRDYEFPADEETIDVTTLSSRSN